VFPSTVAPTGLLRLTRNANPVLKSGYLTGAFVTRSLYYFPDLAARPIPDPVPVVDHFDDFVIDVTQAPSGDIYFASAKFPGSSRIHRLVVPLRGDCDGDGLADYHDVGALMRELEDGDPHATVSAQDGAYRGSWGCDANADSRIDSSDLSVLTSQLSRRRAVRAR
jgi:hypothetical protein